MAAATRQQPSIYAHQEELRRFFWRESELGITSTTGAIIARIIGGTDGTSHDHDGRMVAIVDRQNTIGTFRRTWRALRRMDDRGESHLVVVLHLLFGHAREPDYPAGTFGDVARIVHLTDTAEALRSDLAASDATTEMAALESGVFSAVTILDRQATIEEAFWREAGRHTRAARALTRARAAIENGRATSAQVHDAKSALDASTRRLGALLAEYDREPGVVRALVGACTHADRAWSARDALRHSLAYHGPREPDGKPVRSAYDAWTHERSTWTKAATREAESLREQALTAYRSARAEVA